MRARRICFLIIWVLSLWAVFYFGMAVYYYLFMLFSIVFIISVVQLILSYFSFSMTTSLSSRVVEKNSILFWSLLPKAHLLPAAHVKVTVKTLDASDNGNSPRKFIVSPSIFKSQPVHMRIVTRYCGTFALEILEIELIDIFCLWHLKIRPDRYVKDNPEYVSVLPDCSSFLNSGLLYDEIMLPVRRTRERADAVGIREYMRGDNMRSVHWKYSARIGKLHVKEYEKGAKELHLVYLDLTEPSFTGAAGAKIKDQLICSAASLCHSLLQEQIPMIILGYSAKNDGRFSLFHAGAWDNARRFLSMCEFTKEIPSEYKEMIAGYILAEKSTLTVFSTAVTASPLSFLTYRAGDYSSVSVCFIPQPGFEQAQQALAHLYSDEGIQTMLLCAPFETAGEAEAV